VLGTGRQSEPDRTGVMLIRVWLEGGCGEPQLRIRIVSRRDLAGDADATASAATIEEALVYIRGWLERFSVSGP
jgi:hypothetical protein